MLRMTERKSENYEKGRQKLQKKVAKIFKRLTSD